MYGWHGGAGVDGGSGTPCISIVYAILSISSVVLAGQRVILRVLSVVLSICEVHHLDVDHCRGQRREMCRGCRVDVCCAV